MSPNEAQEEFEEVQLDLRKREDEVSIAFVEQLMKDAGVCPKIEE